MSRFTMRLGAAVAAIGMLTCSFAQAQVEYLIDHQTGQISNRAVEQGTSHNADHLTIYSVQSPQGSSANVTSEAAIYQAPNNDPLTYSVFLNLNDTAGALFPGVMFSDNMGLGGGYVPGSDNISSYDALFFRSSGDPQPGLADFHMELWDGDPLCAFDTIGGGYACGPIAGTEADFVDIPGGTAFTATAVLPKGVTSPHQRVWMVVSGSETGVNPSPCRLGWDIAYGPTLVGDNAPGDFFLTQEDENNGADGVGGEGACCADGSACSAAALCASDAAGTRGHCFDDFAEVPHSWGIATGAGTRCEMNAGAECANFTASVYAPANTLISIIQASDDSNAISVPSSPADLEFDITIGNWDADAAGTTLNAWETDLEISGYYTGVQGFLSPTEVACATDQDCRTAFGSYCQFLNTPCTVNGDCTLPGETCAPSSLCGYPGHAGICQPGFISNKHPDYVYLGENGTDLKGVDLSLLSYRYASAVADGSGAVPPNPFPARGAYAGTLRLSTSPDCKGNFSVGFIPPPFSVLVDQNNEFIPLIGFVPATITCQIARCCIDLAGAGGCWDNVTQDQCAGGPGITFWDPDPTKTCDDDCIECLDDAACQDGLACNGFEVCDSTFLCGPGTPISIDDGVDCTDDACVEDGNNSAHVENVPNNTLCDDGGNCNGVETCNASSGCVTTGPVDCDDGDPCSTDTCVDPEGVCSNISVDDVACPSGDPLIDCGPEATACGAGSCGEASCCLCAPQCPTLTVEVSDTCAADGAKVMANIVMGAGSAITGAQFTVQYDPACLTYNDITSGQGWVWSPPNVPVVDEVAGTIFYAVGVNPFGGMGITGPATVATVSFLQNADCGSACDDICLGGANPYDTNLTFEITNVQQSCVPDTVCGSGPDLTDTVSVSCPGDQTTNADCDFPTAVVTWSAPTCDAECGACELDCTGTGPNGEDLSGLAMGGGEHPIGVSTYNCVATGVGACTGAATCGWTVTVNDEQTMDVTVQLSPILAGDLQRCIKFELFSNCVEAPIVVEKDLFFGGAWDHIGHFTDAIKVPVGQFACVTARDQKHSLRACAYPDCANGEYSVVFKGDPFFGGNWLVQGNLDGAKKSNPIASHDVIDILDFGAFVANWNTLEDPNTPCPSNEEIHADINGDGIVDDLDFAFISMNFLASSKDCCCGAATAAVVNPITSISVKELRQTGNADLISADLNRDGFVDTDDVTAFLQGDRPAGTKPDVRTRTGSGLRR